MATIIERIVEPVIEDPVVDILAEPVNENAVVGLVPELKLGPVSRRGRPHQSGDAELPEEMFSDSSGPGTNVTDPGRYTLQESGNFSFPPRSGAIEESMVMPRQILPSTCWGSPLLRGMTSWVWAEVMNMHPYLDAHSLEFLHRKR